MIKKIDVLSHSTLNDSRPKTLAEQAYEMLEERLISFQLKPGSMVNEAALVKELGIGRTPIREALQKLAQVGLITIVPHKGIQVSEINALKLLKLLELRQVVEHHMVRSAATRRSEDEKKLFLKLAGNFESLSEDSTPKELMHHESTLLILIAQATCNEYFCRVMECYSCLFKQFWYRHTRKPLDTPHCSMLHAALSHTIAKGDPDTAAEAHSRLIAYLVGVTRQTLSF